MIERPILFSAPMVRAILDGRKTQTRRIMKVQPSGNDFQLLRVMSTTGPKKHEGKLHWAKLSENKLCVLDSDEKHFDCPYGKVGDRLWVRETWQCLLEAHNCKVGYAATPDNWKNIDLEMLTQEQDAQAWHWAKKIGYAPSIHMPRWASRINLEITGVRVERLNDISEADAQAEGCAPSFEDYNGNVWTQPLYKYGFRKLWESINGAGSWSTNPWVWVVEFKRV